MSHLETDMGMIAFIVYYCGIEADTSNVTKDPHSSGRSFQFSSRASENSPLAANKEKIKNIPELLIQGRSCYKRRNPAMSPHLSNIDQSDPPRGYHLQAYQLYPDALYSASWTMKSVATLIALAFC
jgi:hypothetical protein